MDYKQRIEEIRRKIDSMSIEEIAADLETYVGDLEMEISIVDKKDSGIFFDEDDYIHKKYEYVCDKNIKVENQNILTEKYNITISDEDKIYDETMKTTKSPLRDYVEIKLNDKDSDFSLCNKVSNLLEVA